MTVPACPTLPEHSSFGSRNIGSQAATPVATERPLRAKARKPIFRPSQSNAPFDYLSN